MFTPEEEKKGKSTGFEWSTAGPPMTPHKRERERASKTLIDS